MTLPSSFRGRPSRSASWLPSLLLGVTLATWGAGCEREEEQLPAATPISQARAGDTGSTVTIEGAVSVAPGTFVSAMGDEGFAIQDNSGGIYVKVAQKLEFGQNARVRVTGTLDEQNKLRILKAEPANVQTLQGMTLVVPVNVTTAEVNESREGQLVRVSGNVTQTFQDDSPYGYKLYINDGSGEVQVFVHVSAGLDKAALQALTAGQRITVVGLTAQYESTYEVAPRQPSDLTVN